MTISLLGVDKVAPNACSTLTALIYSVISNRSGIKSVTIYKEYVEFSTGLFSKNEKVYYGSDIECINRVIQKKDNVFPSFPSNNTTVLLMNILYNLTPGHYGKI